MLNPTIIEAASDPDRGQDAPSNVIDIGEKGFNKAQRPKEQYYPPTSKLEAVQSSETAFATNVENLVDRYFNREGPEEDRDCGLYMPGIALLLKWHLSQYVTRTHGRLRCLQALHDCWQYAVDYGLGRDINLDNDVWGLRLLNAVVAEDVSAQLDKLIEAANRSRLDLFISGYYQTLHDDLVNRLRERGVVDDAERQIYLDAWRIVWLATYRQVCRGGQKPR